MLENNDNNPQYDSQPVNIVMECLMAIANDPAINENKKLGDERANIDRIKEILAQFGVDRLLVQPDDQEG